MEEWQISLARSAAGAGRHDNPTFHVGGVTDEDDSFDAPTAMPFSCTFWYTGCTGRGEEDLEIWRTFLFEARLLRCNGPLPCRSEVVPTRHWLRESPAPKITGN